MKLSSKYIALLAVLLTAAATSCTCNDGNIGFWFGQWKVSSISVNDTIATAQDGTLYFAFQSGVISQKMVYSTHAYDEAYGSWSENEAQKTVTFTFYEDLYKPIDGYLSTGDNILSYSHSGDNLTLTLADSTQTVVFKLVKW